MSKKTKFVKLSGPAGTHPLIWGVAVVCTVVTMLVIVTGIVVFVGYLVIRPKVPFVSVSYAQLDTFKIDRSGLLTTKLIVVIKAENHNTKAYASFSDFRYSLEFDGTKVASLQAKPFEVPKNYSVSLNYMVSATPIPLDSEQRRFAEAGLDEKRILFELSGKARARWRLGMLGSVGFWCRLHCRFSFRKQGDSLIVSHCSSRSAS